MLCKPRITSWALLWELQQQRERQEQQREPMRQQQELRGQQEQQRELQQEREQQLELLLSYRKQPEQQQRSRLPKRETCSFFDTKVSLTKQFPEIV